MTTHRFFLLILLASILPTTAGADPASDWNNILKAHRTFIKELTDFKRSLARQKQRFEKGASAADQHNACVLGAALNHLEKTRPTVQELLDRLNKTQPDDQVKIVMAIFPIENLTKDLAIIQTLLTMDPQAARFRHERLAARTAIKQMNALIQEQKAVTIRVETGQTRKADLHAAQVDTLRKAMQLAEARAFRNPQFAKQIRQALEAMKKADRAIDRGNNPCALQDQKQAIRLLTTITTDMVHLEKDLRATEVAYLQTSLAERCRRMVRMQRIVRKETAALYQAVIANNDQKPNAANRREGARLANAQQAILAEINLALNILVADGSAIAFTQVLKQVKQDMDEVHRLLQKGQSDDTPQKIETDIIDILEDAINALTKNRGMRKVNKTFPAPNPNWSPPQAIVPIIERIRRLETGFREAEGKMVQFIPRK
jgi:hypothetical protein